MESKTELKCPYCGKDGFSRTCHLSNHINHCKENPNSIPRKPMSIEQKEKIRIARTGMKLSKETKKKLSIVHKKICSDKEYLKLMSDRSKRLWEDDKYRNKVAVGLKKAIEKESTKKKKSEASKKNWKDKNYIEKRFKTMKMNGSFNTSSIEMKLKEYFDSIGLSYIYQYRSDKYPFNCDFYFPEKDLYVEIQGTWLHGGRPYIDDDECNSKLEIWRSKKTKFYDNAIKTWTINDVKKRIVANDNKLNWIEIFSCDFDECVEKIFLNLYNK